MCKASSDFARRKLEAACTKLNRLYGKALADRNPSSEFARRKTEAGGRVITSFARLVFRNPSSAFAFLQTRSGRSSYYVIHTPIFPPTNVQNIKRVCPSANAKRAVEPLRHSRAYFPAIHAQSL